MPGRVFLDPDRTVAALTGTLQAGGYPVVHFALVSEDDDSFLLLGDGRTLALRDLHRLRFAGVDLVTLSACDMVVELNAYAGREVEGLGGQATALSQGQYMTASPAIRVLPASSSQLRPMVTMPLSCRTALTSTLAMTSMSR